MKRMYFLFRKENNQNKKSIINNSIVLNTTNKTVKVSLFRYDMNMYNIKLITNFR
jgi:hypothetical protein